MRVEDLRCGDVVHVSKDDGFSHRGIITRIDLSRAAFYTNNLSITLRATVITDISRDHSDQYRIGNIICLEFLAAVRGRRESDAIILDSYENGETVISPPHVLADRDDAIAHVASAYLGFGHVIAHPCDDPYDEVEFGKTSMSFHDTRYELVRMDEHELALALLSNLPIVKAAPYDTK